MTHRKLLLLLMAPLLLLSTVAAAQPANPHQVSNPVAVVRLQGWMTESGIPAGTENPWVRFHWLTSTAPEVSPMGCAPAEFRADADTLAPLVAFPCVGEYYVSLELTRGMVLPDGTERKASPTYTQAGRIIVLPAAIDDEQLFGDWFTPVFGIDQTQVIRAGDFDQ